MGERPMWKPKHRLAAADRSGFRYPSDLIDAEWAIIEPMIPPAKHGGRKRTIDVREILNGIFYVLSTGCQWQALPPMVGLLPFSHLKDGGSTACCAQVAAD
jgi:hypothetical protein